MRKFLEKYIYWLLFTVAWSLVCIVGLLNIQKDSVNTLLRFRIQSEAGAEEISVYEADDGSCYVFLPSYTNMEQITVSTTSEGSLAGDELVNGMDCAHLELATDYELVIGNDYHTTVQFIQSSNVATLYINTVTGNMDRIHENQEYEETAAIVLYSNKGMLDCIDGACTIRGRGNATWSYDKKPYSLTLSMDDALLGMGSASNWILLANATDETNLRNKLVYDLAGRVGCEWAPDCAYVDVYLNGNYNGLYLLTEKIEPRSNRLDIDTNSGDFLCKIDLSSRWDSLRNPFKTASGRTVEISEPKGLKEDEITTIEELVNELEQTILSGSDLIMADHLDLDSYVRRYLIDEISANADSDLASSYFYCKDGTFYAGPVWDYDNSFGSSIRNMNPCAFTAKNAHKASSFASPYYAALYENDSFYQRVTELYQTNFLPLLEQLIDSDIKSISDNISAATAANSLRWHSMLAQMDSEIRTADALVEYLRARVDFLSSAWIDGVDYCTVQIEVIQGISYQNTSVVRDCYLDCSNINMENVTWIISETGEIFDVTQPVQEDIILVQQVTDSTATADSGSLSMSIVLVVLTILAAVFLFLCMAATDIYCRIKERRNADE